MPWRTSVTFSRPGSGMANIRKMTGNATARIVFIPLKKRIIPRMKGISETVVIKMAPVN